MYKKRLLREAKKNQEKNDYYYVQPLKDDLMTWHFTFKGLEGTDYEGGIYHGYFKISPEYPITPPDFYFLNENGRYSINKKICTNFTSYHRESWTPAWTIATMLKAIIAHFETEDTGIGSIKKTKVE